MVLFATRLLVQDGDFLAQIRLLRIWNELKITLEIDLN